MKRTYESEKEALAVAKEAMWLAWQAAGGTSGMGALRNNPTAMKDDVWDNAYNEKDYSGVRNAHGFDVRGDYVFGRMLKLTIHRPTATTIDVPDHLPHREYQAWCGKYPTYAALFDAAEQAAI